MNQNIYDQLKERYETFKFHKSVEPSNVLMISVELGLREVTLEEIARYNPNTNDDESKKNTFISDSDKQDRTKEHHELVFKFASLLHKNNYKLYERPVDCLGVRNNNISILCEAKALDGTFGDEVEQVRRCLSQLLYYNLLKINEIADCNKTQNIALLTV